MLDVLKYQTTQDFSGGAWVLESVLLVENYDNAFPIIKTLTSVFFVWYIDIHGSVALLCTDAMTS